jgi:hypothetical protein
MDMIKNGQFPLWNPYSFSGTPLFANVQTAAFYPLNILFLFFKSQTAWVVYILFQPILASLFMYLYLRGVGLSKYASVFSGLAFACIGYTTVWFELGVVGHSALWVPLGLLGIHRYSKTLNSRNLVLPTISIASSVLAGHAQTAVYVVMILSAYYFVLLFRSISIIRLIGNFWFVVLGFGIAALQIVPSLELMSLSARDVSTSNTVFHYFQFPIQHMLTLFAPDFFGNPAVGNFWGKDYGEFMIFVGMLSSFFAIQGIFSKKYRFISRFFVIVAVLSLIFALPSPFSDLLEILRVPVLGTGIPSRVMFLFQLSVVVLAALGIEEVIVHKKVSWRITSFWIVLITLIWVLLFLLQYIFTNSIPPEYIKVAIRNMIIPTGAMGIGLLSIVLIRFRPKYAYLLFFVLFFVSVGEYTYFINKYLPFAQSKYIFPSHPLVEKLQHTTVPNRIYGYETARVEMNLPVAWKVLSPEGYDPLYIRRYGELMHAATTGHYSNVIPRSDALLESSSALQDSQEKQKLLNLLGVKYVLDKDDLAPKEWREEASRYDPSRFRLRWQEYKWKIYENIQSLSRATVYFNTEIKNTNEEIISTLYSPNFDIKKTVLLEGIGLNTLNTNLPSQPVLISDYSENKVTIQANTQRLGYLMLTDAHYPGWNVYINGKKREIIRADYAFRAVELPKGDNIVEFRYEPISFKVGLIISMLSVGITALLFFKNKK